MIFAVDFDGTIVDHEFPKIGREKPGAIKTLLGLQNSGHKVIIWTCREDEYIDKMLAWLKERGFNPDAVNKNIEKLDFARSKIYADVYLDDRSFPPFSGWEGVFEAFI